jgi:hypothetical protein
MPNYMVVGWVEVGDVLHTKVCCQVVVHPRFCFDFRILDVRASIDERIGAVVFCLSMRSWCDFFSEAGVVVAGISCIFEFEFVFRHVL